MCYLDVATDAEALPLGGEEGVGHLLRGGLDLLLHLLPGDTLGNKSSPGEKNNERGKREKDAMVLHAIQQWHSVKSRCDVVYMCDIMACMPCHAKLPRRQDF